MNGINIFIKKAWGDIRPFCHMKKQQEDRSLYTPASELSPDTETAGILMWYYTELLEMDFVVYK